MGRDVGRVFRGQITVYHLRWRVFAFFLEGIFLGYYCLDGTAFTNWSTGCALLPIVAPAGHFGPWFVVEGEYLDDHPRVLVFSVLCMGKGW